ncbi:hypothetical protein SESBI_20126 [Sesbania bispinosa]|nr:hypothetical protein SESBI_20126 [Sesbania bispinosa]
MARKSVKFNDKDCHIHHYLQMRNRDKFERIQQLKTEENTCSTRNQHTLT